VLLDINMHIISIIETDDMCNFSDFHISFSQYLPHFDELLSSIYERAIPVNIYL